MTLIAPSPLEGRTRVEEDFLGTREVESSALWGIHTLRATENFPLAGRPAHVELGRAYGWVKRAAVEAAVEIGAWRGREKHVDALRSACGELIRGRLDGHLVVDALAGGAGTSLHMNVNEVLANRANQILGLAPGDPCGLSPLEDVNRFQSTNDTYPTALRVAAIVLLRRLEPKLVGLQEALQKAEARWAHVVKVGRTEGQDAVLVTLGRECGAWAEALGRDRWRLSKCQERLRVVNLGGTAIGTGLAAPRAYLVRVVDHLRELTGLPLARAENLIEATQNADAFVEVMGMLKTLAANLFKVCADMRHLSSSPVGELRLPARQEGSSIMPGKVNPVIPEAVSQAALAVFGHEASLGFACASGQLELNPFLPLVADALLSSLDLLANACDILDRHCARGLAADEARCLAGVESSTAIATALLPLLSHETLGRAMREASLSGRTLREHLLAEGLVSESDFKRVTRPETVCRLGSEFPDLEERP